MTDDVKTFLEQTFPKVKEGKKAKFKLGVTEPKIGAAILDVGYSSHA
jgi:nucleolar protein 56